MSHRRSLLFKKVAGFDPDYQAVLDEATSQGFTKPSSSQQAIQNQLVLDIKAAGVWSKLDLFHLFATDGDIDYVGINWIDRTVGTVEGSSVLTLVTDSHIYQSSGARGLLTGYTPSTDAINVTLNSVSFGWKVTGTPDTATDDGIIKAGINGLTQTNYGIWLYDTSFGCKCFINNTAHFNFDNAYRNISHTTDSFISVTRSTNDCYLYLNSTLQNSITDAPDSLSAYEVEYLSGLQGTQLQYAYMGGYLTGTEIGDLEQAITDYLAAI